MTLPNGPLVMVFLGSRLALYDHNFFVVAMNRRWRGSLNDLNMCSMIVRPLVWLVMRWGADDDADKTDC